MSSEPLTAAAPSAADRALSADPSERNVRRALWMARRVARNPYIAARPTLKQLTFLLAEEREVLLTGSGGCGKTVGLLMAALADVDRPAIGRCWCSGRWPGR